MPDARISELPLATILGDADFAPLVQPSGAGGETRRATIAQLRGAVLEGRGAHVRDYGAKGDGTTDDAPAIQAAIDDLKASLEDGDAETISAKTQTLIQASMKLGEAMYKAQQGDAGDDAEGQPEASSDDVVDAEFEEVDGDEKKSA